MRRAVTRYYPLTFDIGIPPPLVCLVIDIGVKADSTKGLLRWGVEIKAAGLLTMP
jgi:hypothetical protein